MYSFDSPRTRSRHSNGITTHPNQLFRMHARWAKVDFLALWNFFGLDAGAARRLEQKRIVEVRFLNMDDNGSVFQPSLSNAR